MVRLIRDHKTTKETGGEAIAAGYLWPGIEEAVHPEPTKSRGLSRNVAIDLGLA